MTCSCNCSGRLKSTFESSRTRNQLTKLSCGVCGGKALIDVLGLVSASMLSTVDAELTNFINPELTWKVTKGYRSASRRPRKISNKSLNASMEQGDQSPQRVLDSSVFESEKLGVAILGRHFAEKVAQVPIKKRRHLLRSPSPPPRTPSPDHEDFLPHQPQTPSPHPEEPKQHADSKCASGQCYCPDSYSNRKMWSSDQSIVDFSGIELLAAAACSSSFDDDADNVKEVSVGDRFTTLEGNNSSTSMGTGKLSLTKLVTEDITDGLVVQENFDAVSHDRHAKGNGGVVKKAVPSKDGRLHWDLNTVMDAWDEPCVDPLVDLQKDNLKCVLNDDVMSEKAALEGCDIESKPQSVVRTMGSSEDLVLGTSKFIKEEDKLEVLSGLKRTCIEKTCIPTPAECVQECLNSIVADKKPSIPFISRVTSLDESSCPDHQIASSCVPKHHVASHGISMPGNALCESDVSDYRTFPMKMTDAVTCNKLDAGNCLSELDKVDHLCPSPKCAEFFGSSASNGGVELIVIDDAKGQDIRTPGADSIVNDSPVHNEPKELVNAHLLPNEGAQDVVISQALCGSYGDDSASCAGKLASEDHFSECYGSAVSQNDRGYIAGVENILEREVGYESPIEDGELRDSAVHSWEEIDVENRETECVDYESDDGDTDGFDAVDYPLSENVEIGLEGREILEKFSPLVKKDDFEKIGIVGKRMIDAGSVKGVEQGLKGGALKEKCLLVTKKTILGEDQLQEQSQDVIAEGNDDKGLLAGEFGSRASMGKGLHVEGPSSYNLIHRKNSMLIQRGRSDYLGVSSARAERDFNSDKSMGRERFSFQVRGRNEMDDRWVDSSVGYWDTRRRYPHSFPGPEGEGYSRPRSAIDNSADGLDFHGDRRSINYSSKGMYRPLVRRRSLPVDRDDSYGGNNRGSPPVRGIVRDRIRGRSGIYPQGVRRAGPKEEYHEPMPDDVAAPSIRMPHYLTRRERGFSPNLNRGRGGAHFSRPLRRKSRSRSPTRSPLAWHLQRGDRDVCPRRNSPDFRSDSRMEGMRLPFQKRNFAANDYEESFVSPPRGRLSPQRNTRWSDDDHFRDRRSSPVRMFRRNQRFDSVSYPGRLRPDDYFKPMVRRGRSPQIAGGRGRNYEDNDVDRRKHSDGHEMIHRVRHYDAAVARRSRHDAEGCFEAHNSHNEDNFFRNTIRRDIPRVAREDKAPRCNGDRMYTTASPSGQQDYNEDASPMGV